MLPIQGMTDTVTSEEVWRELEGQIFGVLGMTNANHHSRTAGIVYVVRDRKLYVGTAADSWKARHVRVNPNVSMTIPIAKRIPFLPWIRIPAATITFQGVARALSLEDTDADVKKALFHGIENVPEETCILEIEPRGTFVTYGVGVPLLTMRDTEAARGRAPV